jgi:demethylmenaquinone methyltransferase/2-methoxy-6-polyprenyl-1,4-benzoquinol methylase
MTHYDKNNPSSIRALFDNIAPRYDLGNSILSFRMHTLWNKRLVNELISRTNPNDMIDLCAGTGDIALRAVDHALQHGITVPNIHLVDFSEQMLAVAKERVSKLPEALKSKFFFFQSDVQALPQQTASFDAVSIAYGIRNVKNCTACISEVHRILKSGGWLGIVELTRPENRMMNRLHKIYLSTVLPVVGRCLCSNKQAYNYLCQSIQKFVSPKELARMLQNSGFSHVEIIPLHGGIATLILAQKG